MPAVTFIAPVNSVRYAGAWPVFIDCDDYCCIDVAAVERFLRKECERSGGRTVNRRTGRRVAAVIPVHVFGTPADMDRINELAAALGLAVVEDASEALGSSYKSRMCGGLARLGCLSFNGNKIVTTGGGGMLVTNNDQWAEKAKYLTTQAKDDPIEYVHGEVGYNYRLTNLLAAVGLAQIETISARLAVKRRNFALYEQALGRLAGGLLDQPRLE